MERRKFLKYSALGSAAVVAGPSLARPVNKPEHVDMEEKTVVQLQQMMESGEQTARSIVESYLQRIEQIDKQGPAINAIIELNPDALEIADALDVERQEKGPRSPMHGVPVLIKDNIDTADRMMTTAGSLALEGSIPLRDSFVAQRLREGGALILGKTNLSEWANFRSSRSTSGWSSRGGQTKNPYALDRNPCGSSSGSGAATAASLCAVAIGTETDGSIICPSTMNSLVGIKPTLGLIGRSGIVPIAHSQDTAGPMGRTVADAAALLGILTGVDPRDEATQASQGKSHPDYTRFLDPDGLRGARIGIARSFFGFHEKVDRIIEDAIEAMRQQGAEIVDPAEIETKGKFGDSEYEVLLYEFKADLNAYLAQLGPDAPVRTMEEIIEFNEKNRDRVMPYFGQEVFLKAQKKGPLTDQEYLDALEQNHRMARDEGIDATLKKHQLDAIVAPSAGPSSPIDLVNGDHFLGGSSSPAAVAGYPSITVPAGYLFGLPVGISFIAGAYQEPTLIKLTHAFEQATKIRRPPRYLPTADLSS
jgi:amidase